MLLSLPESFSVGEAGAGDLHVEDLVLAGRHAESRLLGRGEDVVHAEEVGLEAGRGGVGGVGQVGREAVTALQHSHHSPAVQTVGQAVPVTLTSRALQMTQLQLSLEVAASLLRTEPRPGGVGGDLQLRVDGHLDLLAQQNVHFLNYKSNKVELPLVANRCDF